jgi:Protein of unknown function (DUF3551)
MKPISMMMTRSAASLCTLAFMAIATPSAQAGEYCSTNSSGMRGCGYTSLEQCKASMSGINGSCDRDPFYKDANSALAYQPKQARSRTALHPAKQTVQQ